jgi:upstream activation factor subunit UAF30
MEAIQTEIAALRKDVTALMKLVRKVRTFQEDPTGEKVKERTKNNGFNRPMKISSDLKEFLGTEEETMSRSAVTRKINEYVKSNGLKHPDNGRILILDEKLTKLLKPPDGVQVTYLNVQKYLSPHYTKIDDPPEPQAAVVESSTESGEEVTSTTPAEKPKKARPAVKKATAKTAA